MKELYGKISSRDMKMSWLELIIAASPREMRVGELPKNSRYLDAIFSGEVIDL